MLICTLHYFQLSASASGYTVYCKSLEVEKFCGFFRSMSNTNFSSEVV